MDRKKFLLATTGAVPGLLLTGNLLKGQTAGQQGPEPYKPELVKEFVIAGHGDLSKVQSMVNDHPNLIFSKWDWGNGDFEAGIEGAGHVGNMEIIQFLIDRGARITLFILATLGRADLVKPVLEAYPKLIFANGPHGFTLLHHAKLAGKGGESLYSYLQEKGLKEDWVKIK
ncbi:MAG TPA: hypothetical protein VE035_00580 [Puia sp.]|nr:hypothetical protein [Puia sp.]